MVVESPCSGPVVWLTACVHGDEVGGIVVIQEVFKTIRKQLLNGSIYAFPLMNPLGFETASRDIILSKEDLNRSFPGNKNGSLAERIADKTFSTIVQTNPAFVLDLHNDWRKSIPHALLDPCPRTLGKAAYEKAQYLSEKTGLLVIRDTEELKRSLSYNLLQHDIPALTLELGESYVVNERNIEFGVHAIVNILAHLGMMTPLEKPFQYPVPELVRGKILAYSHLPLSSTSGIIRFLAKSGDLVIRGQAVAKIYNTFGKLQETIYALNDGIVLGHTDFSVAFPGVPVIAFGVL
ncbi:MAG: succinylglutamate desuccinylase/aspartoacylase family protein [Candidatus Methanospirareceae archaeon]